MKYLLVFLIVMLIAWKWRSARTVELTGANKRRDGNKAPPTEMVECALCGVHIPEKDKSIGRLGVYCCNSHLRQAES